LAAEDYSVVIPPPENKARIMHITTLRAHQVLNSYVKAGSRIHVTAGQICLSEAPAWGDAYGFFHETMLHEGATYQVKRSGWLLISASKDTEFLLELVQAGMLQRVLNWLESCGAALVRQMFGARKRT
jgi:hypothetical protein